MFLISGQVKDISPFQTPRGTGGHQPPTATFTATPSPLAHPIKRILKNHGDFLMNFNKTQKLNYG